MYSKEQTKGNSKTITQGTHYNYDVWFSLDLKHLLYLRTHTVFLCYLEVWRKSLTFALLVLQGFTSQTSSSLGPVISRGLCRINFPKHRTLTSFNIQMFCILNFNHPDRLLIKKFACLQPMWSYDHFMAPIWLLCHHVPRPKQLLWWVVPSQPIT